MNGYGVTLLIDEVLATDELVEQVRVLAEAHVGSFALVPGDLESHLLLDAVDAAQEVEPYRPNSNDSQPPPVSVFYLPG